jgi:hypothetical protein
MPISNIANTTIVYATGPNASTPGYNDLRNAITDIFGATSTGYGYKNPASSVATKNTNILASDWNNLLSDLNLIWQHQQNTNLTPAGTAPSTTTSVSSVWTNSIIDAINTANTKRYDRPAVGQRASGIGVGSTFPATGTWGASIRHQVTLTWPSDLEANYFFNLGGRLTFNLSYPAGSYTGDNATWASLIDGWQSAPLGGIPALVYDRTKFQTGGTAILFQQGTTNAIAITVVKTSNRVLTISTAFVNAGAGTNLRITNTFNYEYSTGAFNSPQPDIASQNSLGDSYVPVFVARKTLRATTPTAYSYQAQQTSAAQAIYLNNDGTVNLTVTGITFNDDSNVTSVVTSGFGFPAVISSGTYRTFNLAYTGSTPGSYSSGFTINSDNDAGAVTIPTAQTVTAIPFSFTLNPSSVSITKTDRTEYRQKLNIIPANGSYSSYVPSFPGGATGYTLDSTPPDGPIVIFTPGLLTANTYATTVRITVNGIFVDVPISINLTAALDQNLGTWVSALAYDNSVVGMSYDIIGGNRYLTIGVGMGADGSTEIASNGPSYVSTAMQNLGINADPNFLSGPIMYKVDDRYWTQFLRTYGAWPNTTGTPINTYVDRIFTFTAAAGTYNYECSFDNSGYFEVDGVLVGDMRGYRESWRTSISGTFEITSSGSHAVTIHGFNSGGPGAMGVRITDSGGGEVWSTLTPIRSSPAYLYWQEVYRFPIKARGVWWQYAKEELNSYYYCVKDTSALEGQYRWGDYFGQAGSAQSRSMFVVTDETGNGNLQIAMTSIETYSAYDSDSQTLHNLAEAFFYYSSSQWYGNTRYSQLNNGPVGDGSQTLKFVGFDQAGAVQTILAPFPRGGGGGGETTFSTGSSV